MDSTANSTDQKEFRRQRGKILYITQISQPQAAHAAAHLSQVKPDDAKPDDAITLNKAIRSLEQNPQKGILFPKLDMNSVS